MFAHQVVEEMTRWRELSGLTRARKLQIQNGIEKAQKFHIGDIENVHEIFKNQDGTVLFPGEDCMRLPYPVIWIDATYKNAQRGHVPGNPRSPQMANTKEAILAYEITPSFWHAIPFTWAQELKLWIPPAAIFGIYVGGLNYRDNRKAYAKDNNMPIEATYGEKVCALNKDFPYVYPSDNEGLVVYYPLVDIPADKLKQYIVEETINLRMIQDLAQLLSCKNITTDVIKAPIALNKKRCRGGKKPVYDYHILKVHVPNKTSRHGHAPQDPLNHVRVHLCRGHIKTYTIEKPLFGHLVGDYWWQPHVRGQNRDGVVMKDYNIKTVTERRNK